MNFTQNKTSFGQWNLLRNSDVDIKGFVLKKVKAKQYKKIYT